MTSQAVTHESDVVARCQDGDREAFRWVVDEYGDTLFGIAFLMTRNRQAAEDIVQETFVSVWKSITRFKRGRPMKPWIIRILVNHVRMQLRRKLPNVTNVDPDSIPASPSAFRQVERRQEIYRALKSLSKDQREAIVLKYFADLTTKEVAKATGAREGTVKSRLHRAIARMQTVLGEEV